MFYSMGNLLGNPQVGMLFVNFEKPHRLRVQGTASVDDNDPLLREYVEAQLVVRVAVSEVFRNCPRYVHRYEKVQTSAFVSRSTSETPLAPWKRVDDVQIFLSAKDRARVEREGGLISRDEYEKYMTDVGGQGFVSRQTLIVQGVRVLRPPLSNVLGTGLIQSIGHRWQERLRVSGSPAWLTLHKGKD